MCTKRIHIKFLKNKILISKTDLLCYLNVHIAIPFTCDGLFLHINLTFVIRVACGTSAALK